ncbi:MAG: glycoside-pentoside-hexuronide (GPH):cation symporter [Propionibacteriaceae bacterium]|nr:glycoside-pentoside-hexuronide (GPH):cation symporter [Propionibacteriaceae bacterium]
MSATTTEARPAREFRPFGMRDKVGYMFGDFGNDFTFILQAFYFMIFYTNVVGVNPVHVGLLLAVARLFDGFTDIGMGILVDRLPVKANKPKFKRWIKYIAIPVAIASALMYMSFVGDFDSYTMKIVWMSATYFLWGSILYTAINIPYGSMASVVSDNPDYRAQLSVWRSTGANLAVLAITTSLPLLIYAKNDAGVPVLVGERMTIAAAVCAVLAVICYALCYVLVTERVESKIKSKEEGGAGIGKMLASVVSNRALLGLIVAALLLLLANLFLGSMLGYLFLNVFGDGKLQAGASLAGILPSFILIILAPWMSKKFGKAESAAVAMIVGGVVLLVAYFLKPENAWVWIAFYAVAMFCISIFNFLVWAFITDVIDYQEVRTGQRDDGTVYAVYSWARKLGQAGSAALSGVVLGAIGFNSTAAQAGELQEPAVIDGIYFITNVFPAIGTILVGLALLFLYPLKKKRVDENTAILRERRATAANPSDEITDPYENVTADPGAGDHLPGQALPPEVADGDEQLKF